MLMHQNLTLYLKMVGAQSTENNTLSNYNYFCLEIYDKMLKVKNDPTSTFTPTDLIWERSMRH